MKKTNKLTALAMASLMALSLTACGGQTETETAAAGGNETASASEAVKDTEAEASAEGKVYQIGVLQLVQHDALDKANEGFFAALDEAGVTYEADQQNAANEQSTCQTIAEKFANDGKDLIYAIATPAAQAAAGVTSDIPILLSAVTDPAASGLVESNDAPGVNVSGVSDLTPVKDQIELLKKGFPDAKTVGILYSSAESNSVIQAEMAKEAIEALGMESRDYTVSSSNEIQSVVESMVGNVDVIYVPTDNMISAGMATVSMIANDNGLPTVVGESGMVDAGALVTYGIDYYQLGYMAGQQAVDILVNGADITQMPIQYLGADQCELKVNEETAGVLGIDPAVFQ